MDPTGLLTPIAVGNGPTGIAVGEGGVWVADSLDNKVTRIDGDLRSVRDTIPVGRSPSGVAVGAGAVWVANSGDGTVMRIDPRTDRVLATIRVGGSPQAILVADGRVWVTIDAPTTKSAAGGGTLRWEIGYDFDSLDPAVSYFGESWRVLYATCANLLNYPDASGTAGGRLIPEVARSLPAVSADGRTYQFKIRGGFRFSPPSNQTVTAQTFKDTIERALNKGMKAPLAYEFTDIVGARAYMAGTVPHISGVVADGDMLTVHLLAPPSANQTFGFFIVIGSVVCRYSQKAVAGTTQRCPTSSHRCQCDSHALRTLVTPVSGAPGFISISGVGMPHVSFASWRTPLPKFRTTGAGRSG